MTVTGPRLSPVSDILRQAYGIEVGPLVPLAGGYRNRLWRADDHVVRVERAAPENVACDEPYRSHVRRAPARLGG